MTVVAYCFRDRQLLSRKVHANLGRSLFRRHRHYSSSWSCWAEGYFSRCRQPPAPVLGGTTPTAGWRRCMRSFKGEGSQPRLALIVGLVVAFVSLHGSYGQAVYGSRESAQLVELAGCLHTPGSKTDGVIAVGWLADQIVAVVCEIPPQSEEVRKQRREALILTILPREAVAVGGQAREGQDGDLGKADAHDGQVTRDGDDGKDAP